MLTILFDGVAYGMLLFILAVGLAVTMGLMNFINLAHGAFAMAGGYITVLLMQRLGVPFLVCLPLAFLGAALMGALLERTLYRHRQRRFHARHGALPAVHHCRLCSAHRGAAVCADENPFWQPSARLCR